MMKKLQFNAVGLEKNSKRLIELLEMEREDLPPQESRKLKKINMFIKQLNFLMDTIGGIKDELVPLLEAELGIEFKSQELLYIAMSRPSCKNIFNQLKTHFREKEIPRPKIPFDELAAIGDAGEVLALIGDAVLDMAVLETLWDSSMSTKGGLTKQKSSLVSNENLAKLCDHFNLYEYRLFNPLDNQGGAKSISISHEKGTLVEALIAVIYLSENGYENIIRLVPFLQ